MEILIPIILFTICIVWVVLTVSNVILPKETEDDIHVDSNDYRERYDNQDE